MVRAERVNTLQFLFNFNQSLIPAGKGNLWSCKIIFIKNIYSDRSPNFEEKKMKKWKRDESIKRKRERERERESERGRERERGRNGEDSSFYCQNGNVCTLSLSLYLSLSFTHAHTHTATMHLCS